MKICIVSPEIAGPHKNGGIGTFCRNLCKLLAGHQLTLIHTSKVAARANTAWQKDYQKMGVRLIASGDLPNNDPWSARATVEYGFLETSRRVSEFLSRSDFDYVYFQDWQAHGFHSIRLRRMGLALRQTNLITVLHSPSKWIRQGMGLLPNNACRDLTQDFAERYCCENADLLIAPSQHMLDWASADGWRIKGKTRVLPYPCLLDPPLFPKKTVDPQHVIFFGRLETRKGLGIFLDGLSQFLAVAKNCPLREISFLGKPYLHAGQPANSIIDRFASEHPGLIINREFECDSAQALNYLLQSSGVAFLPSLLDNCPFAIIECIERGIPFMAARSGGIPEIAHPENLFEASVDGVSAALASLAKQKWDRVHPYNSERCNRAWSSLHQFHLQKRSATSRIDNPPLVSVCIPYFELPEYLPHALHSIQNQTYQYLEIIVCDDGSHSQYSSAVFEQEKARYSAPNWHFIQQPNCGVGSARNAAARQAKGSYLVFMDADNYACPEMIERMVVAMDTSKADALSCEFLAFSKSTRPNPKARPDYIYRPLGAVLPLGLLENTFGDANAIFRRTAFESIGGFKEVPISAYADWALFLSIHLSGGEVDVIPETLFWYRHRRESMMRNTDLRSEAQRVLESALNEHPKLAYQLASECTPTLYHHIKALERHFGRRYLQQLQRIPLPLHKRIYRSYRRLIGDVRYQNRKREI